MSFAEYQLPEWEVVEAYGPRVDECLEQAETIAKATGSTGAAYAYVEPDGTESKVRIRRYEFEIVEAEGPHAEECIERAKRFCLSGMCTYRKVGSPLGDSKATVRIKSQPAWEDVDGQ